MSAAIILCAGKGSRMNDNSKNKVCFDCAGIPVIKRIIKNMKRGGVSRFVVVVGHMAQSVMDALDGESGIVYAYQKDQKGTGHAALCGLEALRSIGYSGSVIVSMGDKVISERVISDLLQKSESAKAVWGVQKLEDNYNGGRVVYADGRPYGVVEFADAALMLLGNEPEEKWQSILSGIKLNEKKAAKVIAGAKAGMAHGTRILCGREFSAKEILGTPYANAGLYCFDTEEAVKAISECNSSNAQGEIYLTDTLEYFAKRGEAAVYEVASKDDMRTYSTKPELRKMVISFMRRASEFIDAISGGELDKDLSAIYDDIAPQKERYVRLLRGFIERYGDKKVVLTRAPGRVNLMGRHIDHRGGGINVMAISPDTVLAVSPRDDDTVNMSDIKPDYDDFSFSISEMLSLAPHEDWVEYISSEPVKKHLGSFVGSWSNYVKSAVLRFRTAVDYDFCGMDIMISGTIPSAAGLSSSSSIVVATAEAVVALNSLNISDKDFVDMCGEGEWFVGSRGGAGDHAAMKCCKKGKIMHLSFKPFTVGDTVPFSDDYAIVVADSKIKAKKSEGSRDKFNAKVAAYEFAFMLLSRDYPEYGMREFRDLAKIRPVSKLYEMILSLPEKVTRAYIKKLLPEYESKINHIFSNHADPGEYELRGVCLYGAAECARADKCMEALENKDYALLGEMMKISHDGDREEGIPVSDALLESLIASNAELYLQRGFYGCSTAQIDEMCDVLNACPSVLGSEIVGAGLGGCVIALVKRSDADKVTALLDREYYDAHGYERSSHVYLPSSGSAVIF